MNTLILISDFSILNDYKYRILENEIELGKAHIDFSPLINFVKEKKIYHSKISVSLTDKSLLEIYRHPPSLLGEPIYTIKVDQTNYFVRKGKGFKIPDLYIRSPFGKIDIEGKLINREFILKHKCKNVATIKGFVLERKKEYKISYDDSLIDYKKLLIGIGLVLDNLYHDY